MSVTVTDNGNSATTTKTLTKWNTYVIDWRRDIIIPPDGAETTPYNESRLINDTRCAFRACDDKAFFQNLSFYNMMASF